jgi:tRNA (mo5U34)-methyltransferase
MYTIVVHLHESKMNPQISQFYRTLPPAARKVSTEELILNRDHVLKTMKEHGPPQWYNKIEIRPGCGIFTEPAPVIFDGHRFMNFLGVDPATLAGKRVLDVGSFTGGMSFFAEDCGAEVVSIDVQSPETNGFSVLHALRGSQVTHVMCSVYDLHPDLFGTFDVVIFSGVHYHFRHPVLALERVNSVMNDGGVLLCVGTIADYWLQVEGQADEGADLDKLRPPSVPEVANIRSLNDLPISGFYRGNYLGDRSNWFIPNLSCLKGWIETSGFAVEKEYRTRQNDRRIPIGSVGGASIRAVKIGPPETEFDESVYASLRLIEGRDALTVGNHIPTPYDVWKAGLRAVNRAKDATRG